jgi:hypothetical protein
MAESTKLNDEAFLAALYHYFSLKNKEEIFRGLAFLVKNPLGRISVIFQRNLDVACFYDVLFISELLLKLVLKSWSKTHLLHVLHVDRAIQMTIGFQGLYRIEHRLLRDCRQSVFLTGRWDRSI